MSSDHNATSQTVRGTFQHPIFSPRGGFEGCLIQTRSGLLQLVFDEDERTAQPLVGLTTGQMIVARAQSGDDKKRKGEHPVATLLEVVEIDGNARQSSRDEITGAVVRFNYARHGEANGVILDSGDFVHLKPEGFKAAELKIGDSIAASGPTRPLCDRSGHVVEANTINGKPVVRKPHTPKKDKAA